MTLYVIRHAIAEDKACWADDDHLRPLTDEGRRQAAGLAAWFGVPIGTIASSTTIRCIATVLPLAHRQGVEPLLRSDLLPGREVDAAGLARQMIDSAASVLCTHGEVIPAMLDLLDVRCENADKTTSEKGSVWELERQPNGDIAGRYHRVTGVT